MTIETQGKNISELEELYKNPCAIGKNLNQKSKETERTV